MANSAEAYKSLYPSFCEVRGFELRKQTLLGSRVVEQRQTATCWEVEDLIRRSTSALGRCFMYTIGPSTTVSSPSKLTVLLNPGGAFAHTFLEHSLGFHKKDSSYQ